MNHQPIFPAGWASKLIASQMYPSGPARERYIDGIVAQMAAADLIRHPSDDSRYAELVESCAKRAVPVGV